MSLDMSPMSGEPEFGMTFSSAPEIVSFVQMWLYAAPGVHLNSSSAGMRVGMSFWQLATTFTVPIICACLRALLDHVPWLA